MSAHRLLPGILIVCCAVAVFGVLMQNRKLTDLRAEQQQWLASNDAASDGHSPGSARTPATGDSATTGAGRPPSSELLQLRSQVSQLTEKKRALASVRAEGDQLKAQLAARRNNTPAAGPFPPGFIRKSEAKWVGMATPENSVQSFLWAMQNRDLKTLLQVLTTKSAQELLEEVGDTPDKFFDLASGLPGMRIVSQQPLPDGSIEAQLEVAPGMEPRPARFQLVDGQWRLDLR